MCTYAYGWMYKWYGFCVCVQHKTDWARAQFLCVAVARAKAAQTAHKHHLYTIPNLGHVCLALGKDCVSGNPNLSIGITIKLGINYKKGTYW